MSISAGSGCSSSSVTRKTMALKPQVLLAEETIPYAGNSVGLPAKRRAARRGRRPRRLSAQPREQSRMLDGFLLLDSCHVEFPDEATRAVLQGMEIRDVAGEDLQYFTNLTYVDLGDNRVELHSLAELPAIEQLHLHCNALTRVAAIPDGAFLNLSVLDLSYNALGADAVEALAALPKLKQLDLTCNGLRELPASMARFAKLEILSLESNKLESDAGVLSLSTAPRLRELNLSYNYLRRVPETVVEERGFPALEWLNLAHNYIASEADLVCLVELSTLTQVVLYGNPIGASKHEMPLLNSQQVEGRVINLVTDPPDLRKRKTGRGSYAHFRVARVVEQPKLTASQWRAVGNRQLFSADEEQGVDPPPSPPTDGRSADAGADGCEAAPMRSAGGGGGGGGGGGPSSVFLTEPDLFLGDVYGGDEEDEDHGGRRSLDVPETLLGSDALQPPASAHPDPTKLRLAVNSLRYALKHPLTSHSSVADEAAGFGGRHYEKMTALQKARMKPRRPYVPKPSRHAAPPPKEGQDATLSKIEYVLDRLKTRVADVEGELGSAVQKDDQALVGLIGMVNQVMTTFDDAEEAESKLYVDDEEGKGEEKKS